MCLLFWTINRKHMYILQSINVFLFLDPTRYIPQIRFVLRVKRVMIEVLRSRGGLHDARCKMIILKSAIPVLRKGNLSPLR